MASRWRLSLSLSAPRLAAELVRRSLPYQCRQLLNEIDAIATPGGQGIVLWRRFTTIATLSMSEASRLTPRKVSTIKRAFGIKTARKLQGGTNSGHESIARSHRPAVKVEERSSGVDPFGLKPDQHFTARVKRDRTVGLLRTPLTRDPGRGALPRSEWSGSSLMSGQALPLSPKQFAVPSETTIVADLFIGHYSLDVC